MQIRFFMFQSMLWTGVILKIGKKVSLVVRQPFDHHLLYLTIWNVDERACMILCVTIMSYY